MTCIFIDAYLSGSHFSIDPISPSLILKKKPRLAQQPEDIKQMSNKHIRGYNLLFNKYVINNNYRHPFYLRSGADKYELAG